MMRAITFILILFSFTGFGQLPDDFSDQLLSTDWDLPLGLTFDESGRMYVWEKAGLVYVVDTSGNKSPEPMIDIHEEVGNWRDHGLLGFALDPDFLNNGHFYLLYAVDRHHLLHFGTPSYHPDSSNTHQASIGRITRYTADLNGDFPMASNNSRKVLLGESIDNGLPLYHESHGVGTLLFGEDGTLLASVGDGNSNTGADIGGNEFGSYAEQALADGIISADEDIGSFKSLYIGSLAGKVLRLDPETGDGLPSNPFYDANAPRSARSRVWATGFRNPFRMTLITNSGSHNPADGNPGTIYVGDVGASQWEELDILDQGGLNFGWPLKEGLIPHWGFWGADHPDNQLAPNPLYNTGSCSEEFFNFKDLFAEARANGQVFFPNPCDPAQPIPESAFPRMETIPVLTWGHNEWNLPTKTLVGVYDNEGKLEAIDISSPDSPVESDIFDGNSSIAGTYYNGENFPEYYRGKYFHADYSGWIKVLHFDENHNLQKVEPFHDNARQVIHMTVHPTDGCLYYLSFRNGGSIRKICYGGNPPPIAIAEADTLYGPSPLTVQFDAGNSYDPFGLPITFHWDFGDGSESTSINPSHTFSTGSDAPTPIEVKLTVTDSLGVSTETSLTISLNNTPPKVQITTPLDSSYYAMSGNTILRLEADVIDDEHHIDSLHYEWQTFLHHNSHFHPEEPAFEQSPLSLISPIGCEIDATYWFRIRLTVSDPAGLTTIRESEIFPYCGSDFFELTNLQGSAIESSVRLDWEILSEDDVLRYEVQRSPFFQTIGQVNSDGIGTYTFTDTSPLIGDNVYRIKVVRNDGVYEYSNTVKIPFPTKGEFSIYPNPTQNVLNIELKKAQTDLIRFELYDAAGQLALKTQWPSTPDQGFSGTVLTQSLANGIYFFRLIDGSKEEQGKISVMR